MHSKLALLLVALLALAFLIQVTPRLGAPFGASHDGFNGSLWSVGSRELRTRGAVPSKLGADLDLDLGRRGYAHHPPLIYAAVATSELFVGERPEATRLPVVVASVFLVFIVFFLLCELGLAPLAAALGVGLAFSSPMFFVYGALPDTAIFGLAFAALLLLLWQRYLSGKTVSSALIGTAAAASALASWQGVLVAVLVSALAARRLTRHRELAPLAVILGTVLAVVAVFAWIWWVYGSFDELRAVSEHRSGGSVAFTTSLTTQGEHLQALFPVIWVLAPLACVAAIAAKATRTVGLLAVSVVVGYALVFRQGAFIHDYWNYWTLLPLAIGLGALLQWVSGRLPERPALILVPLISVAVLAGGLGLTARAPARLAIVGGRPLGEMLAGSARRWPPSQRFAFYQEGQPFFPNLAYYARRPPRVVRRNQVSELCTQPDFLVLDAGGSLRRCDELRR